MSKLGQVAGKKFWSNDQNKIVVFAVLGFFAYVAMGVTVVSQVSFARNVAASVIPFRSFSGQVVPLSGAASVATQQTSTRSAHTASQPSTPKTPTQPKSASQPTIQNQKTGAQSRQLLTLNTVPMRKLPSPSSSSYYASSSPDENAHFVMKNPDTSSPPRLIMNPSHYTYRATDPNVIPLIYMSDHREISYPKFNKIAGHTLEWYDRDCGAYAPGDLRVCWHPFMMINDQNTDGDGTYNISVTDRQGNVFTTTFRVTWYHKRYIWFDANGYDKREEGNNIVITLHAKLRPEGVVGNPPMQVTVGDYQPYQPIANACDVSKSDYRVNYDNRPTVDAVCTMSKQRYDALGANFKLGIHAMLSWPPTFPINSDANFTITK